VTVLGGHTLDIKVLDNKIGYEEGGDQIEMNNRKGPRIYFDRNVLF
jgi:hypothetical protein